MNERIKLLADQAGFMDSWFSESGDDCERELKKFAQLIVAECEAYVSDRFDCSGPWMRPGDLNRHFGVD